MEQKQMNRRQFLKGAAIAVGASALAACAKAGNQTSGGAAPAGQQVTIVQYYHQYGEEGTQQAAKKYADSYTTANPKVKVDMQWIAGDYTQKLNAALLTAQGPDVFETGADAGRYKAGQIVALDDLFTAETKADFEPKIITENSWKGKIMGVKEIIDTGFLCCRKSMLDKAGVKPPTTFPEVLDAAKKLTSDKVKGMFIGNDGIGGWTDLAVYSTGSDMIKDGKTVAFNTDRAAQALSFVKQLNDEKVLLIGAPTDWWDPSSLTQGLAAMQWMGMWAVPAIKKAIGDDFYAVPFPKFDDQGKPVTFMGGWAEFVNAKGKHVDESKAFTKWLWIDNTADQKDWALSYGFHIPCRMSVAKEAAPLQADPVKSIVQYYYDYGRGEGPLMDTAMWTAFNNAVSNIVKNGADAKSELDKAAKTCQTELDSILA